jgi:carbamoyltransferase
MNILGISAYYHDSAACLVTDGRIVAAAQEERFTRRKHDPSFPARAARFCLDHAGLTADDIDAVVFYEKPVEKFGRILGSFVDNAPRGGTTFPHAMAAWIPRKLRQRRLLASELAGALGATPGSWRQRLQFSRHHLSHAASAFFPSPFTDAAVLTMDGVGEWETTTIFHGKGSTLTPVASIDFPNSLGLLYSAFTHYCGFKVNSGEYKLMGLAPYGTPRFADTIRDSLVRVHPDGSFRLALEYFNFVTEFTPTNAKFWKLFGREPRDPESDVTQLDMDVAASIQLVTEEIVLALAKRAALLTGSRNLCLAGGVALNCVANGHLQEAGIFDDIWIQPAAGDAGGSLGAALAYWHLALGMQRDVPTQGDHMQGAYLGPEYSQDSIESELTRIGAVFRVLPLPELLDATVDSLVAGNAVGWFQGRMEFGPRALGMRSILADPRNDSTQRNLNLKIKFRESFRPFAPAVLAEKVHEWFTYDRTSPYMLVTAPVATERRLDLGDTNGLFGIALLDRRRSSIPAVTHVDYSARLQTVHTDTNPRFHALLTEFERRTGTPVLVNTSFNVRGEPIVMNPEDAFRCFMGTDMDLLVVGNCVLTKNEQTVQRIDHASSFGLD